MRGARCCTKGENHACTISAFQLRHSGADFNLQAHARRRSGCERQELPHGTAMPLGEFQEDMRVGEGLPLALSQRHQNKEEFRDKHRSEK